MIPYEILIRGNSDGTLSGCHAIDTPGSEARPITVDDLADIAPDINAALLSERDALQASYSQLETLRTEMVTKVSTVLQSGDPELLSALAVEFLTPEQEKKKAAIRAQIAELEAQLAPE